MRMMWVAVALSWSIARLILIRVSVTWAWRRRVTLIIEHDVVGRRWTFQTATLLLQLQIHVARLVTATNLMRRTENNLKALVVDSFIKSLRAKSPVSFNIFQSDEQFDSELIKQIAFCGCEFIPWSWESWRLTWLTWHWVIVVVEHVAVVDDVLMSMRSCVGSGVVIIVTSSSHLRWRHWAFISMKRLQHLLQCSWIDVHVFGAFGFIPLAARNLMLVHDVLVVIFRASSRASRNGSFNVLLLMLQRSASLRPFRLASFLRPLRLLVIGVVLIYL